MRKTLFVIYIMASLIFLVSCSSNSVPNEAAAQISESDTPETKPVTKETESTEPETKVEYIGMPAETDDPFIGKWMDVGGRWGVTIEKTADGYIATEEGVSSYRDHDKEVMTCTKKDGILYYSDGTNTSFTIDEERNEASIVEYTDGSGYMMIQDIKDREELYDQEQEGYYMEMLAKEWVFDNGQAYAADSQPYLVWARKKHDKRASDEYVIWYSSQIKLSENDFFLLDSEELRIARNEIFARHGRIFDSEDLQKHFDGCSWYEGTISGKDFDMGVLSEFEQYNLKAIAAQEDYMMGPVVEITEENKASLKDNYPDAEFFAGEYADTADPDRIIQISIYTAPVSDEIGNIFAGDRYGLIYRINKTESDICFEDGAIARMSVSIANECKYVTISGSGDADGVYIMTKRYHS